MNTFIEINLGRFSALYVTFWPFSFTRLTDDVVPSEALAQWVKRLRVVPQNVSNY